jgi:hypothetical protein
MRKSKKMIINSLAIVIGAIVLLYFGVMFANKQILHIPKKDDISYIEIYGDFINDISKHHTIEGAKDISEIYNVLLSGKKSISRESVNELPTDVNGKLTRIVLTDNNNNNDTWLYAYQANNGKYYIERPYIGICEISIEGYKIFTQYFIAS